MKDVVVIDQAVPKVVQDMLESIATGEKINWCRNRGATYNDSTPKIFPTTPNSIDAQQFTHLIYDTKQPVSQLFPVILPVLTAIPYTIKQLIRIKMNLCVHAQLDNPEAHGMPHVDFTEIKEPLMSAIYYVNDATGDTLIFDQRFGHKGALTVKTRVTPKKGRLLVFDGGLLHAGNTPRTNTPRINININAFVYEGAQTVQADAA
ncbi:MAG: hypothetical protein KIS79_02725 [Burkholderiales bacterium]|nr:hypothetical protein [Burkholderiales bacterium]